MDTKEVMTDCTLCYHSCGVKVTVQNGDAVKVVGLKEHPLTNGRLCPKGGTMLDNIYSPERIQYPLKKVCGKFERISWEQALDEISSRLLDLKAKYVPESSANMICWPHWMMGTSLVPSPPVIS